MRIAIMQPYFIPYAGYFRLFCAADLFVIFDCVQFVRRGWIHRNRLLNINGELKWLTLPLQSASRQIVIKDIDFSKNSQTEWESRLNSFPQLRNQLKNHMDHVPDLQLMIRQLLSSPLEYITVILKKLCNILDLPFTVVYSSTLNLPVWLKGEERIIAIAKHFGAKEYINLSGGQALYQANTFNHHGIKLQFLSNYQGSYASILECLLTTHRLQVRDNIIGQSKLDG